MLKGEIDRYPEYTGFGRLFVLKQAPIQDAASLYQQVKEAYHTRMQLHWSGFYNTYGVAVAETVARQYNLKTVSDLAKLSDRLVFAANPDFLERDDSFIGLT